jgi:hypothetical protein
MKMKRLADIEAPFDPCDCTKSKFDENDPFYLSDEEYNALEELYRGDYLIILDEDERKANSENYYNDPDFSNIDFDFED